MNILALEPYFGGSHRAFLEGWIARSRHEWTLLTLPPSKWKWRMRHAAITFNDQANDLLRDGGEWDMIFCSDMLNLAEWRGLAAAPLQALPAIAYFHENQLTYPVVEEKEYDYHFAITNMTTALAADHVWFNSAFHRDSFLEALRDFLKKMPDHRPMDAVDAIREKARIKPPCIDDFPERKERRPGPMRILWAARWEHDKDPDTFFKAIDLLDQKGTEFSLSVIGGSEGQDTMRVFKSAKEKFGNRIDRWGYQSSREEYIAAMLEADVIVSTAQHEFFGISVVEAVACGSYPLVPEQLAYPEVLMEGNVDGKDGFFHDGSVAGLADRLAELAARIEAGDLWEGEKNRGIKAVNKYRWSENVATWDDEISGLKALL
jgi:glycosyltransferase involved in cell wall biosynthesis